MREISPACSKFAGRAAHDQLQAPAKALVPARAVSSMLTHSPHKVGPGCYPSNRGHLVATIQLNQEVAMTCRPRRDQAAQESATKLTPHPDRLTQAQPASAVLHYLKAVDKVGDAGDGKAGVARS
jgi:hypothetical protein